MIEELLDLLPNLGPAGETAPVHPNQSNQAIALIDGNDEILGGRANPIDQKGFDVRLHRLQRFVLRYDLFPGFEA